jgi:hypothetical protein
VVRESILVQTIKHSYHAVKGAHIPALCLILAVFTCGLTSCGDAKKTENSLGSQSAPGGGKHDAISAGNGAIAVATSAAGDGTTAASASQDGASPDGTSADGTSSQKLKNADPNNRVTVEEVEAIAADADKGFADGWIDGRDPRVFKSPYKELTALEKAQFAMAYHDLVEKSDQNLGESYKTYIPYKKRAQFARHYWETSALAPKFKASIEKMQVAWIHESLLDGSELWWRAAERRFGNAIDSATQMAHDVEQNMVSKYMEDEGTESTFSKQMSVKTHAR